MKTRYNVYRFATCAIQKLVNFIVFYLRVCRYDTGNCRFGPMSDYSDMVGEFSAQICG